MSPTGAEPPAARPAVADRARPRRPGGAPPARRAGRRRAARWTGWPYVLPALAAYGVFVLVPLTRTVQYSFYRWDGIAVADPVGLGNYARVLRDPELRGTILHAFELIVFFTVLPIAVGLVVAVLVREITSGPFGAAARATLFLPQIVPLAAAAIAWSWMYSTNGLVNRLLSGAGLGGLARPWLGDFTWALPSVGLIGSWVLLGLCTVLLLSGLGKIDPSLYEAARIDGAGRFREFTAVTLPGLRREIGVCVIVTMIAALANFDVVYVSTQGGPGHATSVPGVEVYRLAFTEHQVGLASALAVVLTILVLACVLPVQLLTGERRG